jgi:hypothetical protein
MLMIRIQALEWVQGQIQDSILDNVTTDYPFYDDEKWIIILIQNRKIEKE